MVKIDRDRLANDWIGYTLAEEISNEKACLEWAMLELFDLVYHNPSECWEVILRIVCLSDDESVLANLSAGPVESLIANHPKQAIVWVEEEAAKNPKFKSMLSGVWQNSIPESEWKRLQALM